MLPTKLPEDYLEQQLEEGSHHSGSIGGDSAMNALNLLEDDNNSGIHGVGNNSIDAASVSQGERQSYTSSSHMSSRAQENDVPNTAGGAPPSSSSIASIGSRDSHRSDGTANNSLLHQSEVNSVLGCEALSQSDRLLLLRTKWLMSKFRDWDDKMSLQKLLEPIDEGDGNGSVGDASMHSDYLLTEEEKTAAHLGDGEEMKEMVKSVQIMDQDEEAAGGQVTGEEGRENEGGGGVIMGEADEGNDGLGLDDEDGHLFESTYFFNDVVLCFISSI